MMQPADTLHFPTDTSLLSSDSTEFQMFSTDSLLQDLYPDTLSMDSTGMDTISLVLPIDSIGDSLHTTLLPERPDLPHSLRYNPVSSVLLCAICLSFCLFAVIKHFYSKFMRHSFQSIFHRPGNPNDASFDRSGLYTNFSILSSLLFGINVSILFHLINASFLHWPLWQDHPALSLPLTTAGIILLYGLKTGICGILGLIFSKREAFSTYTHNMWLILHNLGFLLTPLILFFPFVSTPWKIDLLQFAFLIFVFFLLLRWLNGFFLNSSHRFSIFYFILYLCTLEILPILILLKIWMTNV